MMTSLSFAMKIVALVFFSLGAIGIPWRVNWIAAGLFFWLLSTMVA